MAHCMFMFLSFFPSVTPLQVKNLTMTVWDVGGQTKIRPLWAYYFENNDAIVYVVDSSDRARFAEAREELHNCLADDRSGGSI